MDPATRALAERRLLGELRRFARAHPLAPEMRIDTLIGRVRGVTDRRPATHRGAGTIDLDDAGLRLVLAGLEEQRRVARVGRRVMLPGAGASLDPVMQERVDALLAELRAAGASPPRADVAAARLGIPPSVIDGLRSARILVAAAPGIDYAADTWRHLQARLGRLAPGGRLTVGIVSDALGTSRRHAAAILRGRGGGGPPESRVHHDMRAVK